MLTLTQITRLVFSAGLVACAPTPPAGPTVAYYRAHVTERKLMVRACLNDPAQARGRADCTNALEADAIEGLGSLRELPPMDLPQPSRPSTPPSGR